MGTCTEIHIYSQAHSTSQTSTSACSNVTCNDCQERQGASADKPQVKLPISYPLLDLPVPSKTQSSVEQCSVFIPPLASQATVNDYIRYVSCRMLA